jgi:hypothetical protein
VDVLQQGHLEYEVWIVAVMGSVMRNKRNIVVDIKVGYTIKGFVEKNQISHLSIITQGQ